jgi:lipopolysaccharide export system protein LptC
VKLQRRHVAIAAIVIILGAGTWRLSRFGTMPVDVLDIRQRHDPDYVIENFHNTVMTEEGRPQYEMFGSKLMHYADDGSSIIDQPYVIQYTPGQAPTHARGREGYLPKGNSYIRLTGDVIIAHGRDPRSAGAEVRTNLFTLELAKAVRKAPKQ